MGCSTSKAVEQPKKTIIIQQQEPVQHIIPIDDGSVINERRRVQIEEEDRSRKEALEWAEAKRREAKPPKSNKERHAKVLDSVDDKFKSLQAKLIVLYENLRKNDKEDKELPVINQNIKSDARDIESKLEDLQAMPFANDKEYLRLLKKVLQTSKTLDLEYQLLKKQSKKYPQYKKTILGLLEEQYGDLFDDSMTQGSMRKSEVSVSPNSERRAPVSRTSPSRNYLDRSGIREEAVLTKRGEPVPIGPEVVTLGFDDPFDREMAAVMQKQRDDVAFELENAVHEYERLQTNFNVMKTRQENLQKDYRAALQEIKDLQNGNRQVMNANNAIGAENENFKGAKNDVVRKHEQTKQACVELERELVELRALYTQKIAERDLMDQEHEFRVNQLEYEIKRKHEEARDIDKIRKEEDVRLREDERRLLDDERRREEHERKRRDIERKRQEDERRRVEEERIRKEEVRRVELRIEEVDRQRRNREIEQSLPPIVSDFSVGVPVPVVRDTRASVHLPPIVVSTMPTVLPPIHADSREVERKLQEDVRRIQMMNEEADRKRAHMIQQLNMPVMMEVPTHMPIISNNLPIMPPVTFTQAPAPARFGDMVLPNKYSSMTPEDVTVPMRSSLVVVEPPVVVNERPRAEITSNALEMARRARMGTDRGQLMAVMDHTRLEAQNAPISYQGGLGF